MSILHRRRKFKARLIEREKAGPIVCQHTLQQLELAKAAAPARPQRAAKKKAKRKASK